LDVLPPGARAVGDLQVDQCRWPIGDLAADDFAFCCAPRLKGSYCLSHADLSRRGGAR
jgi:hypothetical protein